MSNDKIPADEVTSIIEMLHKQVEPAHVLYSDKQVLALYKVQIMDFAGAEHSALEVIESCESLLEDHAEEITDYFKRNAVAVDAFRCKIERMIRLAKLTLQAVAN